MYKIAQAESCLRYFLKVMAFSELCQLNKRKQIYNKPDQHWSLLGIITTAIYLANL